MHLSLVSLVFRVLIMRNVSNKWGGMLWGFEVVLLGGVVFVVLCKVV